MKTLTDVQIIITEKDGIQYNYKGVLYTEAQFKEKFLTKKYVVVYKEFGDSADYDREVFIGEYNERQEAVDALRADMLTYMNSNEDNDAEVADDKGMYAQVECNSGDYGCEWWVIEKELEV